MSQASKTKHTRRKASDTLRLAITLPGEQMAEGPVRFSGAMTADTLEQMRPSENKIARTIETLRKMGFEVTGNGQFSITARCSRRHFEETFGTRLHRHSIPFSAGEKRQANAFFYPTEDAPWNPNEALMSEIDDAYIQWPHIYMNSAFPGPTSGLPPTVGYHHLRVPGDVTML